jgi:hypothetical protein
LEGLQVISDISGRIASGQRKLCTITVIQIEKIYMGIGLAVLVKSITIWKRQSKWLK